MLVYKIRINFKLQANLGKAFKRMKTKIFLGLKQKEIPEDPQRLCNVVSSVLNNIFEVNSEMCFTGLFFFFFNISQ